MRSSAILFLAVLGLHLSRVEVFAAAEYVTVVKIMQDPDKGIIQRKNGERWLIQKGVGAISFQRYEGKAVLVHSPGLFCGIGSKVILAADDQEARIWSAERLSDDKTPPAATTTGSTGVTDNNTIKAVGLALVMLKYFDPKADDESKKDPIRALKRFQAEQKVEEQGSIGPRTLAKLAELVLRERGANPEGLALAQTLIESARGTTGRSPAATATVPPSQGGRETFIMEVSNDGSIVKLGDGSIFEIDVLGQIKTMLWLPAQKVLIMPDGLLNLSKGQSVKATALK